jgi:hypothetical protein
MKKFFFFLLFTTPLLAQVKNDTLKKQDVKYIRKFDRQFDLIAGGNFWKNSYGEIGFAWTRFETGSKFPLMGGYTVSAEMRPAGDNFIVAPKIGAFAGCVFVWGANALYYTNFDEGSLCLRPEFGIYTPEVKVSYGYNIPITNSDMKGINGSNLSVIFFLRLKGDKFQG